jgi:cell division septum initiation protein DivIVA
MSAEVEGLKKKVAAEEAEKLAAGKEKQKLEERVKEMSAFQPEIARLTKENGDLSLRVKSLEQEIANAPAGGAAPADDFMTKMVIDSLTSEVEEGKKLAAKRLLEVAELKASVEELSALLESGADDGEAEQLRRKVEELEKQTASLKAAVAAAAPPSSTSPRADAGESLQEKLARLKNERSGDSPAEKLTRLKAERESGAAPIPVPSSSPAPAGETPAEKLARLKAAMKK